MMIAAEEMLDMTSMCIVEACETQFQLDVRDMGGIDRPRVELTAFGGAVSFVDESSGFNLLITGNEAYGKEITSAMFMLGPHEDAPDEEMADAIGEFVNIVAGMLRHELVERGCDVKIGLPIFVRGGGCIEYYSEGTSGAAKMLEGGRNMRLQPVIIWKGEPNNDSCHAR